MRYDPEFQAVRVFHQMLDINWVGSIQLPEEIRKKIQKYLDEFDDFDDKIRKEDANNIPTLFKKFMKEIFEKLENELAFQNHQKSMAQTQNNEQAISLPKPKIKIKSIMTKLYTKLHQLISNETEKINSESFATKDLLVEKKFQSLKNNTIKILKLLDISDFKKRKGYQRLKNLLVNYMIGDTTERPRLRRKNCLIIFKKELLKELELSS
jgi:hypothetical protein